MQFELIASITTRQSTGMYDTEIRVAHGAVHFARRELNVPADMIASVKKKMVREIVTQALAKDIAAHLETLV